MGFYGHQCSFLSCKLEFKDGVEAAAGFEGEIEARKFPFSFYFLSCRISAFFIPFLWLMADSTKLKKETPRRRSKSKTNFFLLMGFWFLYGFAIRQNTLGSIHFAPLRNQLFRNHQKTVFFRKNRQKRLESWT